VLAVNSAGRRAAQYDWKIISNELSDYGCARIDRLISSDECREIAELYPHEEQFRSHIHMARHGFGKGEYRYFKYPLPDLIAGLRTALYPRLAPIANHWNESLSVDVRFPDGLAEFISTREGAVPSVAKRLSASSPLRRARR